MSADIPASNSPIALFVYNRCEHTRKTIESLKNNIFAAESNLFIFSDAAKNKEDACAVQLVRDYIKSINGFKSVTIVEREENFGLARSIIDGVSLIVNEYGRIIVLEDDMVTSPFFLKYMNDGLRLYDKNENVASIHAYVYPIDGLPETFFMRGADCWGWATWRDRWAMFEADGALLLSELKRKSLAKYFDLNGAYPFTQMLSDQISGKNNSWAIRWHASVFLKNKFTLYPGRSLVLNIGNDNSGTHCGNTDVFSSDVAMTGVKILPIAVEENISAFQMFEHYFKKQRGGLVGKLRKMGFRIFSALSK